MLNELYSAGQRWYFRRPANATKNARGMFLYLVDERRGKEENKCVDMEATRPTPGRIGRSEIDERLPAPQ